MTAALHRPRAALGALLVCAVTLPLLSGCSLYQRVFHHGGNKSFVGCTERPFAGNADSRPNLKVPDGMSMPDTRNAVRIPSLNTPDPYTGKAKTEPCLAQPPNFYAQPLPLEQPKKKPRKATTPPAPAPTAPPAPATATPAPATTTTPAGTPAPESAPAPAPTVPTSPAPAEPSSSPGPSTAPPQGTGPG